MLDSYWIFYYTDTVSYWVYSGKGIQSDMNQYFSVKHQTNISKLVAKLAVL